MNFEVKIDLRRKARYVAGGHLTDVPTSMTYSTVVSRESVRIAFLIAALNNLNILLCLLYLFISRFCGSSGGQSNFKFDVCVFSIPCDFSFNISYSFTS